MPVFNPPHYNYPDTSETLARQLLGIHQAQQIQQLREAEVARQARLDAAAEEDRQRRIAAEAQAQEVGNFRDRLSIEQLKQALAAQTPMAAAPAATAAEEGAPAFPSEAAGPPPEQISVPKTKTAPIAVPKVLGGGEIQPPPLQYKEQVETEARRQQVLKVVDTLQQLGMKEELLQKIRGEGKADEAPQTREINGRLMGWNKQTKKFDVDFGPADSPTARAAAAAKVDDKAEAAAGAKSVAEAWVSGVAFPGTQKDRTAALVYMDAHPDEFPKDKRPRQLTPAQQDKVLAATESLDRITMLRDAYQKVKSKVGPIAYPLSELSRKLPGTAEDPDFITFNTALRQLDNLDIKRITGAQMSAQEADRLMKGMATGNLKPKDFEAALRIMEMDADRTKEITLFGKRLAKPGAPTTTPAATTPAAATPAAAAAVKDPARPIKYQGRVVPFNTLSPDLQARVVAAGG